MTRLDELAARWRAGGAKVICRHDPAKSGLALSAVVERDRLTALAAALGEDGFYPLELSALEVAEGFALTWRFDSVTDPVFVALTVLAPRDDPQCPSLWPVFGGAEWHERETADFFGVAFPGNPNPAPLLLADDFEGPPPLRKDPAALATMAALGLFGEPEILDPAWAPLVLGGAKEGESEEVSG
jgi:NADH-quinone oxidoreductase subunit C